MDLKSGQQQKIVKNSTKFATLINNIGNHQTLTPNKLSSRGDNSLPKISHKQSFFKNNIKKNNQSVMYKKKLLTQHSEAQDSQTAFFVKQKSVLQRYSWVSEQIDYGDIQMEKIVEENKKLKKSLLQINSQVDKLVLKLKEKQGKHRPRIKTLNDQTVTLELRKKQIQNNQSILLMCQKQYQTLKKRESRIKKFGRTDLQTSIEHTKESVSKTKKGNKELQMVNKNLGNSIIGTDIFLDKMRDLQQQVQQYVKRKQTLSRKNDSLMSQINEYKIKLTNMQSGYDIAQQYLSKSRIKTQSENSRKKNEEQYINKQHLLQMQKKKFQYLKFTNQHTYHASLKSLSNIMGKINSIDSQIKQKQGLIIQSRKKLTNLEEEMKFTRRIYQLQKRKSAVLLLSQNKLESKQTDKKQEEESQSVSNEDPFDVQSDLSSIQDKQNNIQKGTEKILDLLSQEDKANSARRQTQQIGI